MSTETMPAPTGPIPTVPPAEPETAGRHRLDYPDPDPARTVQAWRESAAATRTATDCAWLARRTR